MKGPEGGENQVSQFGGVKKKYGHPRLLVIYCITHTHMSKRILVLIIHAELNSSGGTLRIPRVILIIPALTLKNMYIYIYTYIFAH